MPDFFAFDTPPRVDTPEKIDDETHSLADFRASMSDVRRVNRWLGGTSVVTRQARGWLRQFHTRYESAALRASANSAVPAVPVTFLDVATGSGDIPQAILRVADREGVAASVIGLDYSRPILQYAREETAREPRIHLLRGDAFALPFADRSVDYVTCSLAFHHFGFERSVLALLEMERVARRGWLVNDLRRARSAWYLAHLTAFLGRAHALTRHDAPVSVMRAYSLPEYRRMVAALELHEGRDVTIRGSLFYRVALIREKKDFS